MTVMDKPSESAPAPAQNTTTTSTDDEMRQRYREALERKHAGGPGAAGGHNGPKDAAPTSNAKTKRTFRRKSG
jgi:hypothetical protein